MDQQSDAFPRLEFFWYETKEGEEAATWWGQLVGSTHRLLAVADELDSVCKDVDVEQALTRLAYHVESYIVRAYELRERLLKFLVAHTSKKAVVDKLKKPETREAALSSLQLESILSSQIVRILQFLDDDILLRNMHTHNSYLNLGLYTGNDIFDPADALLDLERSGGGGAHHRLKGLLFNEVRRVATEYQDKIHALKDIMRPFLDETSKIIDKPNIH